jgi:hypothetical protein
MKRFSFKAFAAVAFLHIAGTTWLISAAISRTHTYDRGETFPWLTSLSWIWMPIPVLLSSISILGPRIISTILRSPGRSSLHFVADLLSRTFGAGDTVWPNHSMKPTAPWRCNFSVFATTPCRGLSLSR